MGFDEEQPRRGRLARALIPVIRVPPGHGQAQQRVVASKNLAQTGFVELRFRAGDDVNAITMRLKVLLFGPMPDALYDVAADVEDREDHSQQARLAGQWRADHRFTKPSR